MRTKTIFLVLALLIFGINPTFAQTSKAVLFFEDQYEITFSDTWEYWVKEEGSTVELIALLEVMGLDLTYITVTDCGDLRGNEETECNNVHNTINQFETTEVFAFDPATSSMIMISVFTQEDDLDIESLLETLLSENWDLEANDDAISFSQSGVERETAHTFSSITFYPDNNVVMIFGISGTESGDFIEETVRSAGVVGANNGISNSGLAAKES